MGGGAVITAAAVAAHNRRMQAVLDAFRLAGATAPERARTLDQIGITESTELDQLSSAGIVLPGLEPETWYLSETAYVAQRASMARRSRTVAIVLIAVVALAALTMGILVATRRS